MNAHAPITQPLTAGPKGHSEAVTALEAALRVVREKTTDYRHVVADASMQLLIAVDAYNAAVSGAEDVIRDLNRTVEYLDLSCPDKIEFEAPTDYPISLHIATEQVQRFADLDSAMADAEATAAEVAEDRQHRREMSDMGRYL